MSTTVTTPTRAPAREATWFIPALVLAAALALVLARGPRGLDVVSGSWLMLGAAVLSIGLLVRRATAGFWAITTIFALVVAVFHVGMALFALLGIPPEIDGEEAPWFYSPFTPVAMWMVALAMLSYALAVCLVPPRRDGVPHRRRGSKQGAPQEAGQAASSLRTGQRFPTSKAISIAGMLLVVGNVVLWIGLSALALGPTFFLSSYRDYLDGTAALPFDYILPWLGLGMALTGAGDEQRQTRISLVAFAVFAVLAFPIGLRGEVLFPLAAYVGLRARRHAMPGAVWVVIAAVALLSIIGVVKDVRQVGLDQVDRVATSANPLAAVGELGGTINVVEMSLRWHVENNEPYHGGDTYWGPVDRLMRQGLGLPYPDADNDYRLMNSEISDREGPIGGSVIAEAHHNFGTGGVLVVPFLLGLGLALLERTRPQPYVDAVIGILMLNLLTHVRNAFTPFPFEVAVAFTLLLVLFVIEHDPRRLRAALQGAER